MERTDLKNKAVYVIDNTPSTPANARFLAAAELREQDGKVNVTSLAEEAISDFRSVQDSRWRRNSIYHQERDIELGSRDYRLYIVSTDDGNDPSVTFIALGGVLILTATGLLAAWLRTRMQRLRKVQELKAEAKAERSALLVETAKQAAKTERELNDYVAHVSGKCTN